MSELTTPLALSIDATHPYRIRGPNNEFIADCSSSMTASALLAAYNAAHSRASAPSAGGDKSARTFFDFFERYAMPPKARPSCLVCGKVPEEWPPKIQHMAVPSVIVCHGCALSAPSTAATAAWEATDVSKLLADMDESVAYFEKEAAYEVENIGAGGSQIALGRWRRFIAAIWEARCFVAQHGPNWRSLSAPTLPAARELTADDLTATEATYRAAPALPVGGVVISRELAEECLSNAKVNNDHDSFEALMKALDPRSFGLPTAASSPALTAQERENAARYAVLRYLCCYPFASIGGTVFPSKEACDAHCDKSLAGRGV